MAELTRDSLQWPILRDESITLLNTFHATGPADYARSVRAFVRGHMTLYNEGEELLIHPGQALTDLRERGMLWGDCDDAAMLAAALLLVQGIAVRFKAIEQRTTGDFAHVFLEYQMAGKWIPMDPTSSAIPVYAPGDFIVEYV